MSQGDWFTTYFQYEHLSEMLHVILYASQSFVGTTPILYHITYQNKDILFIHTGIIGGVLAHYHILESRPKNRFVELNKITSDFKFVNKIGNNPQSIYIPIASLVKSTLAFPLDS